MPENLNKLFDADKKEQDRNFKKLLAKETFDKVGYGFGSQQFINILLWQLSSSLFLVGIVNVLRVIFGNIMFFLIDKFRSSLIKKNIISISGIIYGFTFILLSFAILSHSVLLFVIAILISSLAIILYGESRSLLRWSSIKNYTIESFTKFGLIITAVSLFIAAFLLDKYPINGKDIIITIFNSSFQVKVFGYMIVFEIAAICFILAGYFLLRIRKLHLVNHPNNVINYNFISLFSNKLIIILLVANLIIGLVQTIGFSYYSIFVYNKFFNQFFGGFMNIAVLFLMSVFTSLIGFFITKLNTRVYRKFSVLIFGTAMVAFMPLSYYLADDLVFITIGTIIGIIGGTVVGVTNSLIAIELIQHKERQAYFSFTNLISIPFFIVAAPLLIFIASAYNLIILFLALSIILAVLILILLAASIVFKKEVV